MTRQRLYKLIDVHVPHSQANQIDIPCDIEIDLYTLAQAALNLSMSTVLVDKSMTIRMIYSPSSLAESTINTS